MTDRRVPSEASYPPARYRSPHADGPPYHYDNLNNLNDVQAAGTSQRRRRPSRANSGTEDPSTPDAPDTSYTSDSRPPIRNTLKKQLRRKSNLEASHVPHAAREELDERDDTLGYMPKLGPIHEGKATARSRSRGSSTADSSTDPRPLRRRHTDDDGVSRSRAARKHSSLQQRADSFTTLQNPSLTSVLSGATQRSGASGGTNSTVTQQSYEEHNQRAEHAQPRRRRAKMEQNKSTPPPAEAEVTQPAVFQFLQEESVDGNPSSTAESSSDPSDDDEGQSSNAGESQHTTDSPTTSPASTRRSNPDFPQYQGHEFPHLKKPLYASSFVHGHGEQDGEYEEAGDEGSSEEDEDEGGDSEAESDEEHEEISMPPIDMGHTSNLAPGKQTPPRVPSSTSHRSDSRAHRLKQQERELANHILQSPQPQKDFQFSAGQHAAAYPPMPLYSPRAYSSATPASPQATTAPMHGWPPMASFPAPLPIGNAPHQSPEAKHAYPLTVQPPMGAPVPVAQQFYPPFSQQNVHPPLHQAHGATPRATVVGYELLADKLSETRASGSKSKKSKAIVPLYRKFETLNHRVLLHLQDEISELEEELRHLDEAIVQITPRDEAGEAYPASRRGDARYGGELHFKRTELLGRVFQKLGQYNQALTSFNELVKKLDAAQPEDVKAYRAWIEEHDPIDETETTFLEREKDLVAVSRKRSSSTVCSAAPAASDQSVIVWFLLALVFPLLAFAIVPSLLGRLLVIALIGTAELKLVTSTPALMDYLKVQEWTMAASVYFGVMAVLAGLVH